MKQKLPLILTGALTLGVLLLSMTLVTVREGEAAVITTFGKPSRTLQEPGLYGRWPLPIQQVHRYDMRMRNLPGVAEQIQTQDGKNIILTAYAGWRISDPMLFLQRVGEDLREGAQSLESLLRNSKTAVVGKYPLSALINVDTQRLKLEEIEGEMLSQVKTEAETRYGVEVQFVGISRLTFPESITEGVFNLMKAEREQLAETYRSEGEQESIRIRAEADSKRDQILATAEAEARRIEAEGDAKAAEFYAVFQKNPDLAILLQKLESLKVVLADRATVILSTDTPPLDLLAPTKTGEKPD